MSDKEDNESRERFLTVLAVYVKHHMDKGINKETFFTKVRNELVWKLKPAEEIDEFMDFVGATWVTLKLRNWIKKYFFLDIAYDLEEEYSKILKERKHDVKHQDGEHQESVPTISD